jgi:hypothetical protein
MNLFRSFNLLQRSPFMPTCPNCQSTRVGTRNLGKKIGGALGAMTGAACGAALAWRGAQVGAIAGATLGPAGSFVGAILGAALSGLAAGTTIGEAVDTNFLDNHECLDCGYTFSMKAA